MLLREAEASYVLSNVFSRLSTSDNIAHLHGAEYHTDFDMTQLLLLGV